MKNNQTTTEGNLKYHIETIVDSEWQKTDAQRVELLLELFKNEKAKEKKAVLERAKFELQFGENHFLQWFNLEIKTLAHSQGEVVNKVVRSEDKNI